MQDDIATNFNNDYRVRAMQETIISLSIRIRDLEGQIKLSLGASRNPDDIKTIRNLYQRANELQARLNHCTCPPSLDSRNEMKG